MATNNPFSANSIIEKLVNYYGLPAFLFVVVDAFKFTVASTISVQLLPLESKNTMFDDNIQFYIPEDLWITKEAIIASKIAWLANYHNVYDARNSVVRKIVVKDAETFLNNEHLMGFAKTAFHYGLIIDKEIMCVASFSKGRKMNDLPDTRRSFELIRFASKKFCTINGGLTKIIKFFCDEHQPGDIMTYIDPLFGNTNSLIKQGFNLIGKTSPYKVYINKNTCQRYYAKPINTNEFITFENKGNYKLKKRFVE